jgi:hypothetical protein
VVAAVYMSASVANRAIAIHRRGSSTAEREQRRA